MLFFSGDDKQAASPIRSIRHGTICVGYSGSVAQRFYAVCKRHERPRREGAVTSTAASTYPGDDTVGFVSITALDAVPPNPSPLDYVVIRYDPTTTSALTGLHGTAHGALHVTSTSQYQCTDIRNHISPLTGVIER